MGRINKKKLIERANAEKNGDAENVKNGGGGSGSANNAGGSAPVSEAGRKTTETPTSIGNAAAAAGNGNNGKRSTQSASVGDADDRNGTPLAKLAKKRKPSVSPISEGPLTDEDGDQSDDYDYVALSAKKAKKTLKKSKKGKAAGGRKAKAASKKPEEAEEAAAAVEAPAEEEEDAEYEVEAIVNVKTENGRKLYRVHWKGYDEAEDTWEDEGTLSCPELIQKFHDEHGPASDAEMSKPTKKATGGKNKKARKSKKQPADALQKKPANNKKKNAAREPEDPNKQWEVLKIVSFYENNNERLFRIRWKGYAAKHDTWEPEANLSCKDLIDRFMKNMKSQEDVETKHLREKPQQTKRLVNETLPRTNYSKRIERTSKRGNARTRVFYGDMDE